jgi:hypothetical protein
MIDSRRATVLIATPVASWDTSTGCTTATSRRPVRWAVMNPNTSAATTSAGALSTTPKKTFRS